MAEPRAEAKSIVPVVSTLYRWSLPDESFGGGEVNGYAIADEGEVVLVDPLPVAEVELEKLGRVSAIVLTGPAHQRSAWRYRRRYGVGVHAPEGAAGFEEEPDFRYSSGDALPGGLIAFQAPGPTQTTCALWLTRGPGVVFLADLLEHDGSGQPRFGDSAQQEEPARTRSSVRRIFERLPVDALCFRRGPPIARGGLQALKDALVHDSEFPPEQPFF